MNAVDVDLSTEELSDLFDGIPCQGRAHKHGTFGHVIDEPAKYIMVCPNCGPRAAQCEGRVNVLRLGPKVICGTCRHAYEFEKWGLVEL